MTVIRAICALAILFVAGCVAPLPDRADGKDPLEGELTKHVTEEHVRRITVRVTGGSGCSGIISATGIVIGHDRVLTNRHVVEGAEEVTITLENGSMLRGVVEGLAMDDDLAWIDVGEGLPEPVELAETGPKPGELVTMAGFPRSGTLELVTSEVIEIRDESARHPGVPVVEAGSAPGTSGGPLLGVDGKLVGVRFGQIRQSGHTLAIPIERYHRAIIHETVFEEPEPCMPESTLRRGVEAPGNVRLPSAPRATSHLQDCPVEAPYLDPAALRVDVRPRSGRPGEWVVVGEGSVVNPSSADIVLNGTDMGLAVTRSGVPERALLLDGGFGDSAHEVVVAGEQRPWTYPMSSTTSISLRSETEPHVTDIELRWSFVSSELQERCG